MNIIDTSVTVALLHLNEMLDEAWLPCSLKAITTASIVWAMVYGAQLEALSHPGRPNVLCYGLIRSM